MTAIPPEPPICRDPAKLNPDFRQRAERVLARLKAAGTPFHYGETLRAAERQNWLFTYRRGSTKCDGVKNRSRHQSGNAADVYPDGFKTIPDSSHPVWKALAEAAKAEGLESGHTWGWDSPHIELTKR